MLDYIRSLHSYAKSFESNFINGACDSFAAQYATRTEEKGPGRPSLNVTEDQIEFLPSMHFSWEKIAQLLQVSVSTLQRRRREFGIDDHLEQYLNISDEELDRIHKELTSSNKENNANGGFLTPNIGRRRFIGALRSRGLRVQRWRVCQCLRRVDPVGNALRWRLVIYRRKYSVLTPNKQQQTTNPLLS